jgi:MauM/NapG family ferredoxin protein
MESRPRTYRSLQLARIVVQACSFTLFAYLLFHTRFSASAPPGPVERFFYFDPLLAMITLVASRTLAAAFVFALVTAGVTLVLGRHVCGWLCPLGSVLQGFSFAFRKLRLLKLSARSRGALGWKYFVLFLTAAGGVFGLNLIGFVDPLSLLYRSFIVAVFPSIAVTTAAIRSVFMSEAGRSSLEQASGWISVLLNMNQTYQQGFLIGVIFLVVLVLNAFAERFWCRYACPAGALLGLLSRWNVVRLKVDADACNDCGLCNQRCETDATPHGKPGWRTAECVYCYTCASDCPTGAISFPIQRAAARSRRLDLTRRKVILAPALGLAAVPLFRLSPSTRRASESLIRPPGSLPEPQFLTTCIRCGECMKVCPTGALQPTFMEAGPEGFWTPVLVPRVGYCEYYCSHCAQVCPTGAIKELAIAEKTRTPIGSAWIKTDRCLGYLQGETCTVCEENCPTTPKAITLHRIETILPDDSVAEPRVPVVDLETCIGCGICENRCPVVDEPAIYCTSVGESRSRKNRLSADILA